MMAGCLAVGLQGMAQQSGGNAEAQDSLYNDLLQMYMDQVVVTATRTQKIGRAHV